MNSPTTTQDAASGDVTDNLRVRVAAQELAARYVDLCDQADWEGVVGLFTEDAVFDASTVYDRVMNGPDELMDFFTSAPVAVAHHATSIHVASIDDRAASARMKMLVLFRAGVFSVDYDWMLRATDTGWRIQRQTIAVQGKLDLHRP